MKKIKPVIMERIIKIKDSNDDWDIKFWQKVGTEGRFSASWKMLEDYEKMRGKNGVKFRLQRTIENIRKI